MKQHLFLTGEIQVGKTTLIQKFLCTLGLIPGGFQTYFGPDRLEPEHHLYLCPAWERPVFDVAHRLAFFQPGVPPQAFDRQFETRGVSYIEDASRPWPLKVFDECGFLEQSAPAFQKAIITALDQKTPVLGVLKQTGCPSWLDQISSHPEVERILVTPDNRDQLLPVLLQRVRDGWLDRPVSL